MSWSSNATPLSPFAAASCRGVRKNFSRVTFTGGGKAAASACSCVMRTRAEAENAESRNAKRMSFFMSSGPFCSRSPTLEDVSQPDVESIASSVRRVVHVLPIHFEDGLRDGLPRYAGGEDPLIVLGIARKAECCPALRVDALVADVRSHGNVVVDGQKGTEIVTALGVPAAEAAADGVRRIGEKLDVFRRSPCPERPERDAAEARVGVQLGKAHPPADTLLAA